MTEEKEKPLVPRSPSGAAVAGGTITAVLGAIGWIGAELVELEKQAQHAADQISSVQTIHSQQLSELDEDVDALRERLAIIEKEVLDAN